MPRKLVLSILFFSLSGCRPDAGKPPDRSTPKSTLRAYYTALRDGDAAALAATIDARDEPGRRQVELIGRWAAAGARLRKAAEAKFGAGAGEEIVNIFPLPYPGQGADDKIAEVEETDIQISGTSAGAESLGARLRLVGGVWKVSLPEDQGSDTGPERDANVLVAILVSAAEDTIRKIDAGKFKTVEEARVALQNWSPADGGRRPAAESPVRSR